MSFIGRAKPAVVADIVRLEDGAHDALGHVDAALKAYRSHDDRARLGPLRDMLLDAKISLEYGLAKEIKSHDGSRK